jgi:hypothetical protein
METTGGQQAFAATMGEIRDPWTPLAELRRTAGVIEGDAIPDPGAGALAPHGTKRVAVLRKID